MLIALHVGVVRSTPCPAIRDLTVEADVCLCA
jgi:hypothetical protein